MIKYVIELLLVTITLFPWSTSGLWPMTTTSEVTIDLILLTATSINGGVLHSLLFWLSFLSVIDLCELSHYKLLIASLHLTPFSFANSLQWYIQWTGDRCERAFTFREFIALIINKCNCSYCSKHKLEALEACMSSYWQFQYIQSIQI